MRAARWPLAVSPLVGEMAAARGGLRRAHRNPGRRSASGLCRILMILLSRRSAGASATPRNSINSMASQTPRFSPCHLTNLDLNARSVLTSIRSGSEATGSGPRLLMLARPALRVRSAAACPPGHRLSSRAGKCPIRKPNPPSTTLAGANIRELASDPRTRNRPHLAAAPCGVSVMGRDYYVGGLGSGEIGG